MDWFWNWINNAKPHPDGSAQFIPKPWHPVDPDAWYNNAWLLCGIMFAATLLIGAVRELWRQRILRRAVEKSWRDRAEEQRIAGARLVGSSKAAVDDAAREPIAPQRLTGPAGNQGSRWN